MPVLEIDGVGKVEVGNDFLSLPADRQAVEVEQIASMVRGGPAPVSTETAQPGSEEADFLAAVNARQQVKDSLKTRSTILPVSRTAEGELTPSVPGIVKDVVDTGKGAVQTVMDLLSGKVTADRISGREMAQVIATLGLVPNMASPATGTGGAIARQAAQRAAPEVAEAAAPVAARAIPEVAGATKAADFKTAAKGFYKQVDDAGVTISNKAVRPVIDDIVATAKGLDEMLTPDSSRALTRLSEAAKQPIPFNEFDNLLQIVGIAKGAARPADRMIAQQIEDKLDDFIAKLSDKDVLSGDAKAVSEFLPKAKDLWSRFRKLETIDGMVERAQLSAPNFSASGLENALRTEFRQLAKNAKQLRKWSPEEQEAIKRVAKGGFKENVARNIGRFSPTGPVSATLGVGSAATAGTALLGPIGGIAAGATAAAIGYGGRRLATALAKRNVEALEKIAANGGTSPAIEQSLARSRATLTLLQRSLPAAAVGATADR